MSRYDYFYSSSILNIPENFVRLVKTKVFNFRWKNKRDKIKRSGPYQDIDKGGLRMIDIEIMLKALKLAWIPRLQPVFQKAKLENSSRLLFALIRRS